MKKTFKRGIALFLSVALLFVFNAFVINQDLENPLLASESQPFKNEYSYSFKDLDDFAGGTDIESFVSISSLYAIVGAVATNSNFYGFLDTPSNLVTNQIINDHIDSYYPGYTIKAGDWVVAYIGSSEYWHEYNGTNWINKGLFTLDQDIAADIDTEVAGRRVAINDADDLFRLGNMASINFDKQGSTNIYIFEETIKKVLSLDYVLLGDIDYSVKKAQRFIPLGTNIYLDMEDSTIEYYFPFTGTFDGQGFSIKNLFLADYNYISTTFQDTDASTSITAGLFSHYSMFSAIGTTGVVKNFKLENPSFDLIVGDELAGLYKAAMLAGINEGTIYNVGVIDNKRTQLGVLNSGINFRIPLASIDDYTAAGFVYENTGGIYNSFFASERVLNSSSTINRFSRVEAFAFINSGNILGSSYISTVSDLKNPLNNALTPSYTENQYFTGKVGGADINLNAWNGYSGSEHLDEWFFYADDGYPSLFGLQYNETNPSDKYYEINDSYDFVVFSRLVNLVSVVNGKQFRAHTFKLTTDINMGNVGTFKAIKNEFSGTFTSVGDTKYIYNLNINTPLIDGSNYYLGIFSRLSGTFKNVNILNSTLTATNTDAHYGKTFYVGMISGILNNGVVENVYVNTEINLGTSSLGTTYAGGLVGLGGGRLENVGTVLTSNDFGIINGNSHDFNNRSIIPKFYVGGIVGANHQNIKIINAFNELEVIGISSTNTNYSSTQTVESFTGGIIGEVYNSSANGSQLKYVTNLNKITAGQIIGKSGVNTYAYAGGIFGSARGYGFKLNEGNDVYNGRLENRGLIKGKFINTNSILMAGGIGVMNTAESYANISYLINRKGYDFTDFNYQTNNKEIYYSSTVVDNSSGGITLSRAYNIASYELGQSFFNNVSGAVAPTDVSVAFFYTSVTNNPSKLFYVENLGNLLVGSSTQDLSIDRKLKISNITQGTRVDYINVINSGDLTILRLNNSTATNNTNNSTANSIYVAGITWILPFDNRAYVMTNVLNEGKIITAGMQYSTVTNGVSGEPFSASNFEGNLRIKNIYVAGLVNINVGEITNSFNMGDITSTYDGNVKNINGTANTFVGGINTFNYNLIKDVANSGLLEYTNDNTSSSSHFVATTNFNNTNNSRFGGATITYTGGVVIAGISAALGDISGTELNGHKTGASGIVAKVIDTINNGDVFGKSRSYVRSGGVLGIALSLELAAGTFRNANQSITAGPFTTVEIGSGDPVGQSLLSNGLNYGNVYAVTATIGNYGTTFGTGSGNQDANAVRPGIHAASGGVIAYGLTKMVRMLNHGTISSTDVAGGIVGATYILGGESLALTPVTEVEINTAVHYGLVKAIKIGAYNNSRVFVTNNTTYNDFNYLADDNFSNSTRFYQENEYGDFIYYRGNTTNNYIETYQQARRGFGGIFGRLQRGSFGTMKSLGFVNVMNMDEGIDFVGRVDGNLVGSQVYYRFFDIALGDTYFTARTQDKSPNYFVGWKYDQRATTFEYNDATVKFTVVRVNSNSYYVSAVEVVGNGATLKREVNKRIMRYDQTAVSSSWVQQNITDYHGVIFTGNSSTSSPYRIQDWGLVSGTHFTINSNGGTATFTLSNYTNTTNSFSIAKPTTSGSSTTPPTNENYRYPIKLVTDTYGTIQNIFSPGFPLMSAENSEYIYAVEEDSLATRFRAGGSNAKPNGMYVLSSSTGSIDGAALPTNIKINNLFRLNENESNADYIDLNNVDITKKVTPDEFDEATIMYQYKDMYQVSYNNKAEVLAEDEAANPKIAELILYDPSGNSPTLDGGVIDRTTAIPRITYTVSTTAFSSNSFSYEILYNELSRGAIIATRGNDPGDDFKLTPTQYSQLKTGYGERVNEILPSDSPVKFSVTGSVASGATTSFYIRIYSEIFVSDQNAYDASKYYQDYQIFIVRSSTTLNINASLTVDGDTAQTINNIGDNVTASNNMGPNGTIRTIFVGSNGTVNGLIPSEHKINFRGLYRNGVLVDPQFYELELIAKGSLSNANEFGFEIKLSSELEAGSYAFKYGFYETSVEKTINITKNASTNAYIEDLNYNYYSSNSTGSSNLFIPTNTDFTTYTEFGYIFIDSLTLGTTLSLTPELVTKINPGLFPYDSDTSHYNLLYNGNVIVSDIKISPFATLLSATISYSYLPNGLKEYEITYTIKPESGPNNPIVQSIVEREIFNVDIYLDNNLQTSNNFNITREAILSRIDIDFNFIDLSLYELITMYVDANEHEDNDEIILIENDDQFSFGITYVMDPTTKTFNYEIVREGYAHNLTTINITKNKGVSAYLIDVKYEGLDEGATIFKYPTINPADSNGNIIGQGNSSYDTRFYPGGIDYLELEGSIYNFKINSEVSDIDLEFYAPGFILPYGAKIQRYDKATSQWTTPTNDVYDDSLKTDYVGLDDNLEVIEYRVIPEENNAGDYTNSVKYFISAIDMAYNLTIRFNIYYNDPVHGLILANSPNSPAIIKNSIVVVSLNNYELDQIYQTTGDGIQVSTYPVIPESSFIGLNSQSSLFYFVNQDNDINFRFGRNKTGAYNFNVKTPKYQGLDTGSLSNNERYKYDMYAVPKNSNINDWFNDNYKLPSMNSLYPGTSGLFYFVYSPSTNPISRQLAIVINPETVDKKWGIYDDYGSFD